ncbi:hypothetical protein EMIT0215P_10549 [Pseudomonas serboccidentalis]
MMTAGRALRIPRHGIVNAEVASALHAQIFIEQTEWNPHVSRPAKRVGHSRAALRAEVVPVTPGFDPTADRRLPCFPAKVTRVDQRGEVVADTRLLAAQGAVAAVKKARFNGEGKAYRSAQTLPCCHGVLLGRALHIHAEVSYVQSILTIYERLAMTQMNKPEGAPGSRAKPGLSTRLS